MNATTPVDTGTSKLFACQTAADDSALEELMELATGIDADPITAINVLIDGLLVKHAGDDGTTSALMAIQGYYLPNLTDSLMDAAQH